MCAAMMRGKGMLDRITEAALCPGEPLPFQSLVELCGDRRVLLEHHKGITEYSSESITVKVHYGYLRVIGSSLEVAKMTASQLVITGCIDTLCVIRRG